MSTEKHGTESRVLSKIPLWTQIMDPKLHFNKPKRRRGKGWTRMTELYSPDEDEE